MVSKNGIIIIRTNRKTFAGKILESIIVFILLFIHHEWATSSNKNKRSLYWALSILATPRGRTYVSDKDNQSIQILPEIKTNI